MVDLAPLAQERGHADERAAGEEHADERPGERSHDSGDAPGDEDDATRANEREGSQDDRQHAHGAAGEPADRDSAEAGEIEINRLRRRPGREVGLIERLGGCERRSAHLKDGARGHAIRRVTRRVVDVAVADRREVEAGDPELLQYREIGVARQPPVDLRLIRAAAR